MNFGSDMFIENYCQEFNIISFFYSCRSSFKCNSFRGLRSLIVLIATINPSIIILSPRIHNYKPLNYYPLTSNTQLETPQLTFHPESTTTYQPLNYQHTPNARLCAVYKVSTAQGTAAARTLTPTDMSW